MNRKMIGLLVFLVLVLVLVLWFLATNPDYNHFPATYKIPFEYSFRLPSPDEWIAFFTCLLFLSTVGLWWMTRKSVVIATRALTDLERPYIFVYGIHWGEAGDLNDPQRSPEEDTPYFVYNISSDGKLPAVMESIAFSAVTGHEPYKAIFHEPWPNVATKIMRPPDNEVRIFKIDEMAYEKNILMVLCEDGDPFYAPVFANSNGLYIRIIIRYHGPFTKGHETSVCWYFRDGGKFEEVGGVEFNYMR